MKLLPIILALALFLTIPLASAISPEYIWMRGDKGFVDQGTAGNTFTPNGLTLSTTNTMIYNASYYASGTGDYAIADGTPTYITGNVDSSVCAWVNNTQDLSGDFLIFYAGNPVATQSYAIGYENHQMAYFGYSNNALVAFTQNLNNYEHYCYTYTASTRTWEYWQNGNSLGTAQLGSDIAVPPGGALELNRWNGNAPGIAGAFNDLRVYDFTLTGEQVGLLYNNGFGTSQPLTALVSQNLTIHAQTGNGVVINTFTATINNVEYNATTGSVQTHIPYNSSVNVAVTLASSGYLTSAYTVNAGSDATLNLYLPPPLNGTDPRQVEPTHLIRYYSLNQTGTQNVIDEGLAPMNLQNTNGVFQHEYPDAYVLIRNNTFIRNLTDVNTRNYTTDGVYGSVNWTFMLWIRLDRLKNGGDGNTEQHVTLGEADGSSYFMYQDAYCLGDRYETLLFGSNTSTYTGSCAGYAGYNDSHVIIGPQPVVGDWTNILITHNQAGLFSIYKDGILDHTQQEAANSHLEPQQSNNPLYGTELSGYAANDPIWQLNAGLARVTFWNATLGLSDVQRLAGITPAPPCTPNWVQILTPTICDQTGIKLITYDDTNQCGTTTNLPSDNGTNTSCTPPPTPIYDYGNTTNLTEAYASGNTSNVSLVIDTPATTVTWVSPVDLSNTTIESIPVILVVTPATVSVDTATAPASMNAPADISMSVPAATGQSAETSCNNFLLYHSAGFYTTNTEVIANGALEADTTRIGQDCYDSSVCQNVQCVNGALTFQAQHFDSFGVGAHDTTTINACQQAQQTIYAGLAIIALICIALAAAFTISMLKGGSGDGITIATLIISLGVIVMIGYYIISAVGSSVCV